MRPIPRMAPLYAQTGENYLPVVVADAAIPIFDDSDLTSLFVGRDGSGGNTIPGDPTSGVVGLQLDKSHMGGMTAAAYIDSRPNYNTSGTVVAATNSGSGNVYELTATSAFPRVEFADGDVVTGEYWYVDFAWSGNDEGSIVRVEVGASSSFVNFGTSASGTGAVFIKAGNDATRDDIRILFSGHAASDTGTLTVNRISKIPGQHRTAAADNERPVLDLTSGVYSLEYDGVDDGLSAGFDGGAGPADCSVFFAVKTTDDQFIMAYPGSGGGGTFLIAAQDGSINTSISGNYGTPSYYVNGALQSWSTRGDAHTALATGEFTILECANVDASSTVTMSAGGFSSGTLPLDGNLIGPIIVETSQLTNSLRRSIETYLKRKAGIL